MLRSLRRFVRKSGVGRRPVKPALEPFEERFLPAPLVVVPPLQVSPQPLPQLTVVRFDGFHLQGGDVVPS